MTYACELLGFPGHKCLGGQQLHHVVNKSKLRGNAQALEFVTDNMSLFGAYICEGGNVNREADGKAAQAYFWRRRVDLWGTEYCRQMLEALRQLYRVPPPELALEALLSHGEDQATL